MTNQSPTAFNSSIDIGLRSLMILSAAFPDAYSLDRLVLFDYFVVHSDDLPDGPPPLHPRTPHRSGEILIRRELLRDGIRLFESRGLLDVTYQDYGIRYVASELAGGFLDTLTTPYARTLRLRSSWVTSRYGDHELDGLRHWVAQHLGDWGAEFEMESVLWEES